MPGIVIFVHGVNDPGGNYDIIEKGLCDGLNERLDAFRLIPGRYGDEYAAAHKSKLKPGDDEYGDIAEVKYDPDTYLYKREEVPGDVGKRTHSVFIPFYWGYRAAEEEIAYEKPEKDEVTRRYKTVRGQYQDIHGNRLSKHFAKGGGMFNNATTSLPAMFEGGFYNSNLNAGLNWARDMRLKKTFDAYQFSGTSPHRRYMVLAAERLAMLVREIRRVAADDTITIMGHSQGTLVTLLAQAILAEGNPARTFERQTIAALPAARRADTLILVDSPYSIREPAAETAAQYDRKRYSTRGKVNTLVNIVGAVTEKPHTVPPLADLSPAIKGNQRHLGQAGMLWKGAGDATRRQSDRTLVPFVERDNRGKVYMYYCPEDGTVSLPTIKGIGVEGVPDRVPLSLNIGQSVRSFFVSDVRDTYPAMATLAGKRFFQRAWTRRSKDKDGKDTAVGQPPPHRLRFEGGWDCQINAEAISPPYVPAMHGGEVVKGDEKRAGLVTPNDYAKDLAIGNPDEHMPFVVMSDVASPGFPDMEAIKRDFNKDKEPDDQTYAVRVERLVASPRTGGKSYLVAREETPNETRARMQRDQRAWQENNYHSAILSDADNLRRVVAFDVAVGQAKVLDDPDWRRLFIGLADWKMDKDAFPDLKANPRFTELSNSARALAEGCKKYYQHGIFPASLVRTEIPSLVDAERR
ncbi:T6SS effector phospholipase Tle3 domain-containing protein [Luteibacter sp.]|uniref:T6SS effector phospholipase Tle3 domain-containing protein n=1 Tax=Luteibacter sp. TaxID=1886636 RepID=UPI002F420D92